MKMHDPPHPGEIIKELCLEPLGLSVTDAAKALGKISADKIKPITLQRALHSLTQESRGSVLEKLRTTRGVRYRFVNQLMRQYILARQFRDRYCDE